MSGAVLALGQKIETIISTVGEWGSFLNRHGMFTCKEIADRANCSKQTARKYLDVLVECGYIERSAKVGRNTIVYTYKKGE